MKICKTKTYFSRYDASVLKRDYVNYYGNVKDRPYDFKLKTQVSGHLKEICMLKAKDLGYWRDLIL